MAYQSRVEALRRCFGQETDMGNALQELASLKRGKIQNAKDLVDSARRLASQAHYLNPYASHKEALHAFQSAVGEELHLKCADRGSKTLEKVEIRKQYTKKAVLLQSRRRMRPRPTFEALLRRNERRPRIKEVIGRPQEVIA